MTKYFVNIDSSEIEPLATKLLDVYGMRVEEVKNDPHLLVMALESQSYCLDALVKLSVCIGSVKEAGSCSGAFFGVALNNEIIKTRKYGKILMGQDCLNYGNL